MGAQSGIPPCEPLLEAASCPTGFCLSSHAWNALHTTCMYGNVLPQTLRFMRKSPRARSQDQPTDLDKMQPQAWARSAACVKVHDCSLRSCRMPILSM